MACFSKMKESPKDKKTPNDEFTESFSNSKKKSKKNAPPSQGKESTIKNNAKRILDQENNQSLSQITSKGQQNLAIVPPKEIKDTREVILISSTDSSRCSSPTNLTNLNTCPSERKILLPSDDENDLFGVEEDQEATQEATLEDTQETTQEYEEDNQVLEDTLIKPQMELKDEPNKLERPIEVFSWKEHNKMLHRIHQVHCHHCCCHRKRFRGKKKILIPLSKIPSK